MTVTNSTVILLFVVVLISSTRSVLNGTTAFVPHLLPRQFYTGNDHITTTLFVTDSKHDNNNNLQHEVIPVVQQRREFLKQVGGISIASLGLVIASPNNARAVADDFFQDAPPPVIIKPKKDKILVLGGTGFVGSQVVANLRSLGIDVVATSRNGRDNTIPFDVTKLSDSELETTIQKIAFDATAIISTIGSIGTPQDEIINSATGRIAQVAKSVGVKRFVYITVAPEVKEFANGIDFLEGYMKGKSYSRASVVSAFGPTNAILIEPTFIYGGDEFTLNPPRVATFYGQFIEGLLSSSVVRSIESIAPPGIIKIALEPPIAVDDVANTAVAGALGKLSATPPVFDTYDKIKDAATAILG